MLHEVNMHSVNMHPNVCDDPDEIVVNDVHVDTSNDLIEAYPLADVPVMPERRKKTSKSSLILA